MTKLLKIAQFLQKKPTDITIRILRVVLPALTILLLILSRETSKFSFGESLSQYEMYISYILSVLFIIPAIAFGAAGLCGFKKGTMKKLQMIGGLFIWFIAITLEAKPETKGIIPMWTIELWLVLYGSYCLIGGITGKLITESCIKYKEVIKKIRV